MQIGLENKLQGVTKNNIRSLQKLVKDNHIACFSLKEENLFEDLMKQIIHLSRLHSLNQILNQLNSQTIQNTVSVTHLFIDLYDNNLNIKGMIQLGQILRHFNLETLFLNLNRCSIHHKGLKSFGDNLISTQKNLKALKILLNEKVYTQGVWCLFSQIGQLSQLEELDIRFNSAEIDGQGIQQLSLSIQNLQFLSILQLNFYNNKIDNNGFKQICKSIKKLDNLSELFLDFSNNIGLNNMTCLKRSIYNKNFKCLSFNFIGNQITEMNLKHLTLQTCIEKLNLKLSNNNLTPSFCFDFFISFPLLRNLDDLRIWIYYNDRIQQTFFELLCLNLHHLSNLKNIQLSIDPSVKGKERLCYLIINCLDLIQSVEISFKDDKLWNTSLNKILKQFILEQNILKLQCIVKNKLKLII